MTDGDADGLMGLRIDVRNGVPKIFATVSREGIPLLKAKLDILSDLLDTEKISQPHD